MIGILYESDEWSDWKLHEELENALGEKVMMIDMESEGAKDKAYGCEMLVSRIFASAAFRGHDRAAQAMVELSRDYMDKGLNEKRPMINPAQAHFFETSKYRATKVLEQNGIAAANIAAMGLPADLMRMADTFSYPCIIKPDCGGRTTHTAVLECVDDARRFLANAQRLPYIVENYIAARKGFVTRIEVIDGKVALIVKRSIEENGLSSYHEGSTYALYPDCPQEIIKEAESAAKCLDIGFGSFDIIESTDGRAYIIDANSVSNVSEDCTELFKMDLMKEYAQAIAKKVRSFRSEGKL